jgi:hypothetical protein
MSANFRFRETELYESASLLSCSWAGFAVFLLKERGMSSSEKRGVERKMIISKDDQWFLKKQKNDGTEIYEVNTSFSSNESSSST